MDSPLPVINAGRPTELVESFAERLRGSGKTLRRASLTELQLNLGKLCNQTCTHSHVEAGPTKTRENMPASTADRLIELVDGCGTLATVDLTGGAPEMNPAFRRLVTAFRQRGLRVIDRCNLTILTEPGYEWVAPFLTQQQVSVVASLPCYLEENVDGQRGRGVFGRSIEALRMLNEFGYGGADSELELDLVFNPTGPSLPPDQASLELAYKRELRGRFGIEFNRLLTITNMPIKRCASFLHKRGKLQSYLELLAGSFNEQAVDHVMCRSLISVSWDGSIYDCDFNQMTGLAAPGNAPKVDPPTIWNITSFDDFVGRPIATADHCYGCTAGCGSSCGGAMVGS